MDSSVDENFDDRITRIESNASGDRESREQRINSRENEEGSIDWDSADIDDEALKKIERDSCAIRLTWPEVDLGDSWAAQLPASYRTVSDKEKLLLRHAENFRKRYHATYTDRKPLLLACDNECGVQKFVSTSVRPSTLPYPELYTWQGCASFVSDHLDYEPPERPLNMPVHLRSPTWMMTFQRGNSFEYATLLASLLLGKGYNAYVISGYASREQVLCDTSMRTCPHLTIPEEPEVLPEPVDTSRYRMKSPPDFKSQLLLDMEAREARKAQEELDNREREREEMLLEQELPPPDDYWGNRIHAWVLILPEVGGPREQEIQKPLFIEATSGLAYSPEDEKTKLLYHGVESLWNDKNYWINMQSCEDGCCKIDWNFKDNNNWEHLLPGESLPNRRVEEDEDVDEDSLTEHDRYLDMPFSYVDNIEIQSLDFERRYPNGTKTMYLKKTKVDFYAPYVQMDGLTRKITMYEDYEYKFPIQVHENYSNRADMLVESKKYLDTCITVDYYKRGRLNACKEHCYSTDNIDGIDDKRTLEFYNTVRIDGLSKIEMDSLYLTQHYIGRRDFLYYRHVEYSMDEKRGPRDRIVSKITEKYNRNEGVPASKDIAIRDFDIAKSEIRLNYHYEKNRITRATKRFLKPSMDETGEHPTFNPDLIQKYDPDPMAIPEKQLSLFYELEKQLREEADCLILVREAENEISAFLRKRNSEYIMPKLIVSIFDRNRNEEAKAGMLAKEEALKAQTERDVDVDVDYLGPYLARIGNPTQLTKTQASYVRQECLNGLKNVLTDRANHISQMFDECSKELNRVQNWLTQTEGKTKEEEDDLLNLTNDINFHLHTLDVRLQRHCEFAPERYRQMLTTLKADERLSTLYE